MTRKLGELYTEAAELAVATLGDVAEGSGRAYRTVQAYLAGDRSVTRDAARGLAAYLRERAFAFHEAAERLERATMPLAEKGETDVEE